MGQNTITVGEPDYPTIQSAINGASDGATIFVPDGTYYETIVVNRSVSIVGQSRDGVIIVGTGSVSVVVDVQFAHVQINSLTIQRSESSMYGTGVMVTNGESKISNLKISGLYIGLAYFGSTTALCSNNIISGNAFGTGIRISLGSNNMFSNNVISNNVEGLHIYQSDDNVFSGNSILNNTRGLISDSSVDNEFFGNSFANMDADASLLFPSTGNTFYRNNFHAPVHITQGWTNSWNTSEEGNYWSGYAGVDIDSDGIGDDPYVIDGSNTDFHPLMGEYYSFETEFMDIAYDVSFISNSSISNIAFAIGKETGNRILSFDAVSESGSTGFCRVEVPDELMSYPFVVVDGKEISATKLNSSDLALNFLYFTFASSTRMVSIISSRTLFLYNQLLDEYNILEKNFEELSGRAQGYDSLNSSYALLLTNFDDLNLTYYKLLDDYENLLANYTTILNSHASLNSSYQDYLTAFYNNVQNLRNLIYIFVGAIAMLLAVTVYLSKKAHSNSRTSKD